MIEDIVDHWICDWCGAREVVTRPCLPPEATFETMHRWPNRMDVCWPKGWWGFSPGDLPWKLQRDGDPSRGVLASMCAECLALPIISVIDEQAFLWDASWRHYMPAADRRRPSLYDTEASGACPVCPGATP